MSVSVAGGRSIPRCPASDSVPCDDAVQASLAGFVMKASSIWLFCRLSLIKSRVLLTPPIVRAFGGFPPTMPFADFCTAFQRSSRISQSRCDTVQISRGKFDRLRCTTAGSTSTVSMDGGLCGCLSARPDRSPPSIRFVFLGSHLCSTLPSDPVSRRCPCASLTLHLHAVG